MGKPRCRRHEWVDGDEQLERTEGANDLPLIGDRGGWVPAVDEESPDLPVARREDLVGKDARRQLERCL